MCFFCVVKYNGFFIKYIKVKFVFIVINYYIIKMICWGKVLVFGVCNIRLMLLVCGYGIECRI